MPSGPIHLTIVVEFEFVNDSWQSRCRRALVRWFAKAARGRSEVLYPLQIHVGANGVGEVREAIRKVIAETQRAKG